ncbi:MAG: hypothetical protein HKN67_13345 [Saprospiraceae bacterium]|nr:hypothetical protein [Bacteroidia bacterium]MBT8229006.1 hypothetical protein [Bacteroidia bacterium]NNF22918.1 hypothetical protein [Saprospiraceae bacterium]NNK90315.1 hypothetical protein [Saprospiraceae bacterium]
MKNILFSLLTIFFLSPVIGQESLIADIMNVDAVNINESEKYQEALEEYQKAYDEEVAKMDEALTKLGEDYVKEVTGLIDGFTKTLDEGVEKDVKNEKQSVVTQVTTLTMLLKSNKKKEIQNFKNVMDLEIRALPKTFASDKNKEVEEAMTERKGNIESEFKANQMVIAQFKNTEHLIKTNEPVSSGDSNG